MKSKAPEVYKHAEGVAAGAGNTLCGLDELGAGLGDDDNEDNIPPTFAAVGKAVTCPTCRQIIDHCKRYNRYIFR